MELKAKYISQTLLRIEVSVLIWKGLELIWKTNETLLQIIVNQEEAELPVTAHCYDS